MIKRAAQEKVRLSSFKLLLQGNPSAARHTDSNFTLPIHLECQHHYLPGVVQFLLSLDVRSLHTKDHVSITTFFTTCVAVQTTAVSKTCSDLPVVSKRNAYDELLTQACICVCEGCSLFGTLSLDEQQEVVDRKSVDYI